MKTIPWLISMAVHGMVLLLGGLAVQQAVVGIAPARNSIAVNLVAAPSDPSSAAETSPPVQPSIPPTFQPPQPQVSETPISTQVEPISVPAALPPALPSVMPPITTASSSTNKASREHSRRTSSTAGKDTVTAQADAGAIIDEEPDYLSNPAPIYPEEARDQNQQGLVVLDVIVSPEGRSETIHIVSTSSYYLLDDAARDAVRHYRFRPAILNGMKVRAHVKIPIRFRLDS